MKEKSGSTGVTTTHQATVQFEHGEQRKSRQSSGGTHSTFQRQLRRSRLAIAIAGSAIAFLLGVFLVSCGSKLYENWRERRLLHQTTTLLQEGKLSEAAQMAQELVRRRPDSLAALSILADTAERQNLEEAVAWRERIARLLPRDPESQLNLASAALRFGKLDLARETLNRVSPSDRDGAAFHVVAGWLARAEGNFAEQEEQFAAAVKKEPKNDLYQFNLAALQIRSKDAEKSKDARDTLERLITIAPYRTGALRALLNDAVERNDRTAADGFAQQLQMSPEVTFADYLLCLNFYRKLDEKKFRQLLEKVKPFAARNASDLASLIEWMNQNGLAGDVVKWVDKLSPARLTSPPASVAVADAYGTVKNWSRLKRWTRTGNWGDAEYLRLAYGATAERHLRSGNDSSAKSEFETLWRSAAELSEDVPERELMLARLATKWQLANQAEELWMRVEENSARRREALDNLRQLYRAKDETTKLYAILQRLHESSPNEAPITADLALLGLDLGENTESSHQLAKEAYDRAPNEVNCAVTYAFSLHRLGRNAEALAIIQSLAPDQLHDPHAAVYVALVLVVGNELEGAKDYIAAAENGKLYPEEKKLLEEAKTKLIMASAIPSSGESPPPTATPPL
ncbi:MAG TPA: tetratricopeptide repeat protein [Candidatus Babeliales bacterium]|jgi:predicted Zn-dependent protease|nr:tetratricopeptide repeat protein [Candidatus Babeliales bacterium]